MHSAFGRDRDHRGDLTRPTSSVENRSATDAAVASAVRRRDRSDVQRDGHRVDDAGRSNEDREVRQHGWAGSAGIQRIESVPSPEMSAAF